MAGQCVARSRPTDSASLFGGPAAASIAPRPASASNVPSINTRSMASPAARPTTSITTGRMNTRAEPPLRSPADLLMPPLLFSPDARPGCGSAAECRRRHARLAEPRHQHLPPPTLRESPQPWIRMYHTRVPHAIEQREVRDGIGVEVAVGEIDALLGRESLRPVDLPASVADWLDHLAGEPAIADDELRDQQVIDPEVGPER